jgi:hypothetical protein
MVKAFLAMLLLVKRATSLTKSGAGANADIHHNGNGNGDGVDGGGEEAVLEVRIVKGGCPNRVLLKTGRSVVIVVGIRGRCEGPRLRGCGASKGCWTRCRGADIQKFR